MVVANWKMNPPTWREAKKLFEMTKKAAEGAPDVLVVVAPPSMYLLPLSALYKGKRLQFAAQHIYPGDVGAFTGEVSLAQVKDARARYCLVGHAERREMGETNEDTSQKVSAALTYGLTPILCIGERRRSASGEHFTFIKEQIRAGFSLIDGAKISKTIVAYEPVWAIGGEKPITPRDMHEMTIFIRKTIMELKGEGGMNVKILYGGSANEENTPLMLRGNGVDGLLVGHVSVDAVRFAALIKSTR